MKKIYRLIIMAAVAVSIMLAMSVSASAVTPEEWHNSVKMTGNSASSVTIGFKTYTPSYGKLTGYRLVNDAGIVLKDNIPATATSVTVTGLPEGYVNYYHLIAMCTFSSGRDGNDDYEYLYVNTTPATPAKSDFKFGGLFSTSNQVYIHCDKPDDMTGYRIQFYNVKKGTSKYLNSRYSTSDYYKITKNVTYKYRVRYYYTNSDSGKTYYGGWSKWKAFHNPKASGYHSSNRSGCRITLNGAKGVAKYKIYVSTSYGARGKYTKTVSVRAGARKSFYLNKIGKANMRKGKTYYVNIYPVIKISGTSYANPIHASLYFYNSIY